MKQIELFCGRQIRTGSRFIWLDNNGLRGKAENRKKTYQKYLMWILMKPLQNVNVSLMQKETFGSSKL